MKNATRVIAIHNHPTGRLAPSKADLDFTDRLIQVGRILNIALVDHLIISTEAYESFRNMGIMDDLEKSLTYVPTYQMVEQIRKEEKKIARDKLALEKAKTRDAKEKARLEQEKKETLIIELFQRGVSTEDIAKILDSTSKEMQNIINKN